jgi:hypothetical protein
MAKFHTQAKSEASKSHSSRPFFSKGASGNTSAPFFSGPKPTPTAMVQPQREPVNQDELEEVQRKPAEGELDTAQFAAGDTLPPPADTGTPPPVQAKLTVGQPNDPYEQEADRVADQVMRMPDSQVMEEPDDSPLQAGTTPSIQRMCADCAAEEKTVQRQPALEEEAPVQAKEQTGKTPQVSPGIESRLTARQGQGTPLPKATRNFMESRMGQDFSGVRIHSDGEAAQLNRELKAQAFTRGQDVFFGAGKYGPETGDGKRLLAHELTHVVQQRASTGPSIQRQPRLPNEEKGVSLNAKRDAAALLEAFQGAGTNEAVVYRILNQAPGVVRAIEAAYNKDFNVHTGEGLVADLKYEFDHLGGKNEWLLVVAQLKRAGIAVPSIAVEFRRHDPTARTRIVATPNVQTAVPGTKITYEIVRGAEYQAPGSYYSYQWYVINDPLMSRTLDKPAIVEGDSSSYKQELTAEFVGNHKIICRVTYHSVSEADRETVFYEFPQTVVPEEQLAADALEATPVGIDPAKELEVLEAFLKVLLSAETGTDTDRLDPKVKESYEKQIAAIKERLASTTSKKRYPIKAVHVDREQGRVSPLKVFVAKIGYLNSSPSLETWTLVDMTNPSDRRLTGEYTGTGENAEKAINAAIRDWDIDNRYPTGRIKLKVGDEVFGTAINQEFQTDGASFWDSISEFFSEVGFWASIGALGAGVATAVIPIPGSRVVSALIWTSILASSTAAVINIAQRRSEGMSFGTEDTMDILSIVGNVLAGVWLKGAKVIVGMKGGSKIATGILIGQFATDGVQGIIISAELIDQYDEIMKIRDSKRRTEELMELLRSAAVTGLMIFISAKSTKGDLDNLSSAKAVNTLDPSQETPVSQLTDTSQPGSGSGAVSQATQMMPDAPVTRAQSAEFRIGNEIHALSIQQKNGKLFIQMCSDNCDDIINKAQLLLNEFPEHQGLQELVKRARELNAKMSAVSSEEATADLARLRDKFDADLARLRDEFEQLISTNEAMASVLQKELAQHELDVNSVTKESGHIAAEDSTGYSQLSIPKLRRRAVTDPGAVEALRMRYREMPYDELSRRQKDPLARSVLSQRTREPLSEIEYSQLSIPKLRRRAVTDPEAAEALRREFRKMPYNKLARYARRGDPMAQSVISQRTLDLEEVLAKAERPRHEATVFSINKKGEILWSGKFVSGNATPAEKELGWPQSSLVTHTERRATDQVPLESGGRLYITGQYDPCTTCQGAMRAKAEESGTTIIYWWPGGEFVYRPPTN